MTDAGWMDEEERGSSTVIRMTARLAKLLGRRWMRPVVSVIALWYRVADRRACRASKAWLERVHGRPATYWEVYRHLRTFAQVTCDKLFLMMGRLGAFEIHRLGRDVVTKQLATGGGAVMLGAHLGNPDALRASSIDENIPVRVLGYFENAKRINQLLSALDPVHAAQVIHIGEDSLSATIQAKTALERGAFVAIHADRVGLSAGTVTAKFMGQDAAFPSGPFLLAALLRCPVYFTAALYREPNHYDLYCVPFAERLEIPRATREASLQAIVQSYADHLEEFARREPYNWFNFYDFWSPS